MPRSCRLVFPVLSDRSQKLVERPLGDLATEPAAVFVRKPEMDAEQDARVHHFLGGVGEPAEQAGVGAYRHGRGSRLVDLETELVGIEVELQELGNGTRDTVGPGGVVGVGRGLRTGWEVAALDERRPGRVTIRQAGCYRCPPPVWR